MQPDLEHYSLEFERVRQRLPVPWLLPRREAALAELRCQGLASPQAEQWRYTNLRPITRGSFSAVVDLPEPAIPGSLHDHAGLSRNELVFLNGHFLPQLSNTAGPPRVAHVQRLAENRQPPIALEHCLQEPSLANSSGPALLNTAFLNDGVLIRVPQRETEPEPIHLLYLSNATEAPLAMHPRNVILLEERARATVIESYLALDEDAHFCNALTQVELGAEAALDHYLIQRGSPRGYCLGTLQVCQGAGSRLRSWSALGGAALGRWELRATLEENARAQFCGIYALDEKRHMDCQVHLEHLAPHSHSEQLFRGLVRDRGRASFSGRVVIQPQAQKAHAHQSSASLLLSERAQAAAQPQLEIYADDVKCSHGATVGRPDEDALFYLVARGLDQGAAQEMLAQAFARVVLEQVERVPVRERMQACLQLDGPEEQFQ